MKFKGITLLGLISALLLTPISASFAEPTPSPSPSSSAATDFESMMDQYKAKLDKYRNLQNTAVDSQTLALQYKTAVDMFRSLQDSRDELRTQINRSFMAAVDKANKEARVSMKLAKSASAKNDVISKQKIAITMASDSRDSAISSLGALPTPPIKPVKQTEPTKQSESTKQSEPQPVNKTKSKKSSPSPTSESEH